AAGGSGAKSSDFYDEYQLRITTNSGEKELVDFLFKLGANNSLIRVRDLTVQPDPSQTRLAGTIMLVASYQKEKPAGKKSVAAAKP
ncbi:MAG: hypothetical protein HY301_18490, partial [Verrucomicrobia bacterium]|nr:hypothetical protein [Verrucomicrobiota bacterium]